MWASDLAAKHLGGPKLEWAEPAKANTHCTYCGRPIKAGEPSHSVALNEYFSATRDLAAFSGVSCPACARLMGKSEMFRVLRSVITEDGIYPLTKHSARAWLFFTPPKPPFVAVLASSTLQHLVWRTPVTLSRELIVVRHGNRLHQIRPALLRRASDAIARLREINPAWRCGPYVSLDREESSLVHAMVREDAWQALADEERDMFLSLKPGEIWALSYADVEPIAPQ